MKKIVCFEIENLKKITKMEVVENHHTEQNFTFKPGMVLFKDVQGQIVAIFNEDFYVSPSQHCGGIVDGNTIFIFFPYNGEWRRDWIDINDLPPKIWEEFLPIAEKGARELQEAIDDSDRE